MIIISKNRKFLLFKLLLEPIMFDIEIKIYNRKYVATSSVAMATKVSNVLLFHENIPMQQSNCKYCPVYLHFFLQGKKRAHFIFETRLFLVLCQFPCHRHLRHIHVHTKKQLRSCLSNSWRAFHLLLKAMF
jgi:hypothetical protein